MYFLNVRSIQYIFCNLLCEVPAAPNSWSETLIKDEPKEKCQGQGTGTPVCFNLCAFSYLLPKIGREQIFFGFFYRLMYSNTRG